MKLSTLFPTFLLTLSLLCTGDRLCAQVTASPNQLALLPFSGNTKIPFNTTRVIHQDPLGFMWIGSDNGLYRYDGFHVKRYASSLLRPNFFTSNEITALSDDGHDILWVGTRRGMNRMSLSLGITQHYLLRDFDNSNSVSRLYRGSNGELWVGTEGGLYRYDQRADSFVLYCNQRGNAKIPHCSVTSICEDKRGFLWFGTWDKGLYRLNQRTGQWYEMPKFNDLNSAQTVYMRGDGQLFVGTWGKGLFVIDNPYDTGRPLRVRHYDRLGTGGRLPSDIVWSLTGSPSSATVWIGTNIGLATYQGHQVCALPEGGTLPPNFFGRGASFQFADTRGALWIYAPDRGFVIAAPTHQRFQQLSLPAPYFSYDYINALAYAPDGVLWITLHNNGIIYKGPAGQWHNIPVDGTTYATAFADDGTTLIATERKGVLVAQGGRIIREYNVGNTPWLKDNCIYSFLHTPEGHLLIGTWRGVSVLYEEGDGAYLSSPRLRPLTNMRVRTMARDRRGNYWLGTKGDGLVRLSGSLKQPGALRMKRYEGLSGSSYRFKNVTTVVADRKGNVWACTRDAGLLRYDPKRDVFETMNQHVGIPDEEVYGLVESHDGSLWLSSRNGLTRFTADEQGQVTGIKMFSRTEVLGDDVFGNHLAAVSPQGTICFGGTGSYATFEERHLRSKAGKPMAHIADIKIFNTPLADMDSTDRMAVSTLLPPYTNSITLAYGQRDVTIELSSMNYNNANDVRFAYKLQGYDKEWHYADVGVHQVNYTNLPSGDYTFLLRSTDDNGNWSDEVQQLGIHVMAPWYLRWYAFVLYVLTAACATWLALRYYRTREESRREIQMARMENKNIEILNHKKLQFFTNITHDLMTPLTVVLATVSNLKKEHPEDEASFKVIDNNTNRLMRLLQQILEFRKSETGNLHLRVERGSLTAFVNKEIESIRPLANSKGIKLELNMPDTEMVGYFDTDALDKILYNLISNATKYNHTGGWIQVTLHGEQALAVIRVSDSGEGIANDKLSSLFTRFYEGEHRRFNTYGTGIGLSLVKDLVTLHHGSVRVESERGKGSTFTVTIPINKEAYQVDEIDDSTSLMLTHDEAQPASYAGNKRDKEATILVVEDNEDLLRMIERLLSNDYRVLTAYNGQEALEIANHDTIDLIVTDIMMPVMDGMELTRRLREDKRLENCPVIMLTAKRDDEDRETAYHVGANAYITKPFNTSVLMARVQNLLQQRQKNTQEVSEMLFGNVKDVKLSGSDQDFIKQCIAVVQRHLNDASFDLPAFAEEMSTSKSTLYKKLRALTGKSTSGFIRSIRMQAACELLKQNPQALISEVAYAVGYNDPKYFSSCFKKDFGCLPSEYLDQAGQA